MPTAQAATKPASPTTAQTAPAPPDPATPAPRRHKKLPFPTGSALAILAAAVLTLLIAVCLLELPVLRHTQGRILFPLDAAFLNISVGRNLAFYQVWGISKHAFQSAASSLLYPLTLAPVFFIAGAHLIIPLVVNFLAAVYFLYALQQALQRRDLTPRRQLLVLVATMILTALPLLVVSGMEYVLQLLFVFLFMETLATALKDGQPISRLIYLYAALAVTARYEDTLIILLAGILITMQRGWRSALKLAAIALSPILLFGVLSLIKGSYFLPNSLLLGPYPSYALGLAIIAMGAITALLWRFARLTAVQRPKALPLLTLGLLLLLALPFTIRNLDTVKHFQRDCLLMYDQQYLTAGFVHRYYYRSTVGIDEPGAISWFSEGRKLDFTGIANRDVIRSKRMHYWSPVYADSLSRLDGIRAAIVSDPWFSIHRLPKWDRIASWNIPDEGSAPGTRKTVTFYAIDDWDTSNLRRNLHDYEHLLPAGVTVRYY
jgi:hypothetical protein